jgi:hypothetical protein
MGFITTSVEVLSVTRFPPTSLVVGVVSDKPVPYCCSTFISRVLFAVHANPAAPFHSINIGRDSAHPALER